jgi:abhydrolase domain-containing protein 17
MNMKGWMRKWIIGEISGRRMIESLILIYLSVVVLGWFLSDSLIFVPQPSSYREGGPFHRIPVPGGERIGMLELPREDAAYTILHCHGNAEDIGDHYEFLNEYRAHGFQVYAFDYRGYGISDGKPGTTKACEDGEAALLHLVQDRGIPLNRIIIHGRSVGAGVACHLAAKYKVAGLILESPFLTAFRVRTVIPIAPFDKFRNNRRIREITCPLLVMHGENDTIIPVWHGKKLYDLATVPKRCWWVPGADHNDILWTDEPGYWTHCTSFRDWIAGGAR